MKPKFVRTFVWLILFVSFAMSALTLLAESGSGPFVVVIGAPAAGKSDSSEMVSEMYGIPTIDVRKELLKVVKKEAAKTSTSHAFRNSKRGAAGIKRKQAMQEAVKNLEAGELVSDDSLNALVASHIFDPASSGGFVLDGYPMTVSQAEFLDSIVEVRGMTPLTVIYLNVPDEVALQRMKDRGRVDDQSDFAEKRLATFRSMIGPLLDYYGEDMVTEVDGTQSRSKVAADVSAGIEHR